MGITNESSKNEISSHTDAIFCIISNTFLSSSNVHSPLVAESNSLLLSCMYKFVLNFKKLKRKRTKMKFATCHVYQTADLWMYKGSKFIFFSCFYRWQQEVLGSKIENVKKLPLTYVIIARYLCIS